MKMKLRLEKADLVLLEHDYDISDAESFGRACADAWAQLRERRLEQATSIGALFEHLNDQLLDELDGARIVLAKA